MSEPKEEFNPNNRTLCADDLCLGLVDEKGMCSICGPLPALTRDGQPVEIQNELGQTEESLLEFEDRELCSDDNCIGVLDSSNCCKECGLLSK